MLNKVILVGALEREPELYYSENDGIAETSFPIMVEHQMVGEHENNEEVVVDIVVYKKQAESCAEHLKMGSCVAITGRLGCKIQEDQQGIINKQLFVIADDVRFMPKSLARNNSA